MFQFSAGVQLLGVVSVLHHPRPPEVRQPRPLHPGETSPLSLTHTYDYLSIHFHILSFHTCRLTYCSICAYVRVALSAGGVTDSHVSRWEDSGVVDCAGNHRHDPLILIAIP